MINKPKYILPTIGPSSEDERSLKQILKLSNVVRLNGSHNTLKWHEKIIQKIKKIDDSTVILFDIPGIKPRTMNKTDISVKKNQIIKLVDKNYNKNSKNVISLSNPIPLLDKKTDSFSISDGQYHFKITKKGKGYIEGKSLSNCIIKPKKGVNIPFSSYDEKLQCKVINLNIRAIVLCIVNGIIIDITVIRSNRIIPTSYKTRHPNSIHMIISVPIIYTDIKSIDTTIVRT